MDVVVAVSGLLFYCSRLFHKNHFFICTIISDIFKHFTPLRLNLDAVGRTGCTTNTEYQPIVLVFCIGCTYRILQYWYSVFIVTTNTVRVRQGGRYLNVPVPKNNLTLFKKFFSYLDPQFYNCLPGYMKSINSENKFVKDV